MNDLRTGRSCPCPITGFTTQPDGSQVAYFTAGSIASGGRRSASVPRSSPAARAVQAQPLVDQNSTLHTLFLTELAVTAGALVLALAGGWWLVRLGSAPARGRGAHRRLHRGG